MDIFININCRYGRDIGRGVGKKERFRLINIVKKTILSLVSLATLCSSTAMAADLSGWAVSEYESASQSGLVSYNVVTKNLKDNITREEVCELIMNLYQKLTGEDLYVPPTSPFYDTDNVAVAQAYCYGIVNGTGDGSFNPQRLVTREEMAKMLVSTLAASEVNFSLSDGEDTSAIDGFADSYQISEWAQASVLTALNNSLMNGIDPETLCPLGSTTREQAIASVNRSYQTFKQREYSVELPEIYIPAEDSVIEEGDFDIEWSPISTATNYHIIIKNSASKVVYDAVSNITSHTVKKGELTGTAGYSITIGAVLADGSEVFSLPVDFTYKTQSEYAYLAENELARNILNTAAQYLGVPYVWGGTSPSGFDCSGFVQYVYKQNGISISRTTYTQCVQGTPVNRASLQPGDLVFFGSSASPHHVGIYVGEGKYIHSPHTGDVVKYADLDYRRDFCYGRRIIK